MTVTAIRWAVIDTLHRRTGLGIPNLNFAKLADRVEAYHLLIEIHYRHYQFYANMAVATAIAYVSLRAQAGFAPWFGWLEVMFVALELVFLGASRDTLSKYYRRSAQLLGILPGQN